MVVYLSNNLLSITWKREIVSEHPKKAIVLLPICYALGCASYALILPVRILKVALHALALVLAAFKGLIKGNFCVKFTARTTLLAGSLSELITGVVGVVCPPLAYQLDECIQSHHFIHGQAWFSKWKNKNIPKLDNRDVLKGYYRLVANSQGLTRWTSARDLHFKAMYLLMKKNAAKELPEAGALEAEGGKRCAPLPDATHLANAQQLINTAPQYDEFYSLLNATCDIFMREYPLLANELFEYAVADPN